MKFQGFTLDDFQEEAVHDVEKNNSVLVSAPTGSGKTLIADYIIDKYLQKEQRIIYTAPIKALSNQKFKDFRQQYGEDKIGLITGDVVVNSDAQILIMTTEIYRNMAILKDPILDTVAYCIMDEIHYISDEERGYIWEESIIFSPSHVRFLFLSATIPNAPEFASWVKKIKNHEVAVIKHHIRAVPLERKFYDVALGITDLQQIKKQKKLDLFPSYHSAKRGRHKPPRLPLPDYRDLVSEIRAKDKLPCIYFVFSRAKTQEYAVKLAQKQKFLTKKEYELLREELAAEFKKISKEVLLLKSAQDLRQCLPKGVAFHNAGLLPDLKHVVEHLFAKGLVKVLFATETFAVGINMPAKTVCFDGLRKFTGVGFRYLNSKEYFQISGRAGRRGIDKTGLSVAVIHRPSADFGKIAEFTARDVLPLKSQFKLTYNTVLNLVNLHSDEEIKQILMMNFYTFQQLKGRKEKTRVLASIKARYTKAVKKLTKMKYIQDGKLTEIGRFASKMFSNELEMSQLFVGDFDYPLTEYSILLIVSTLVYEARRGNRFYNTIKDAKQSEIIRAIEKNKILRVGKWHNNLEKLTAIVNPLFNHEKFIKILANTNFLEGDLIRLLLRISDYLEQVDKALEGHEELVNKVRNTKRLIRDSLEGIHMF